MTAPRRGRSFIPIRVRVRHPLSLAEQVGDRTFEVHPDGTIYERPKNSGIRRIRGRLAALILEAAHREENRL
jgi:hypothetical protein